MPARKWTPVTLIALGALGMGSVAVAVAGAGVAVAGSGGKRSTHV
jgi:hypothetical protein